MTNLNNTVTELKQSFDKLNITSESKKLLVDSISKFDKNCFSYAFLGGSFSYGGGNKGVSDIDIGIVFNDTAYRNKQIVKNQINGFVMDYKMFNDINNFIPDYVFPGEYMTQSQIEDAVRGRSFLVKNNDLSIPILYNDDFLNEYERWFQVWLTLNAFSTYITGDFNVFLENKFKAWKTLILYLITENNLAEVDSNLIFEKICSDSDAEFKIDKSYTDFQIKESRIVEYTLELLERDGYLKIESENMYTPTIKVKQWKDEIIHDSLNGGLKISQFLFSFDEMKAFGEITMNHKPKIISDLESTYDWIKTNNLDEDDLVVDQLPDPIMVVNGKEVISFSSNNYLGLTKRKEVIEAARGALEKYGNGTCESRRLGGNLRLLEELERKIAKFKGTESSIIFATGLLANVGAIPSLVDNRWYVNKFYNKDFEEMSPSVILGDSKNHRSIQMGIKLSRAEVYKYEHCDMNDLERLLDEHKGKRILIITDGVFSMDGDLAPLDKIAELAKKYDATVMVDDAHATGVFGENGRGSAEHFGVEKDIHIKMGTLSKALAGLGGFVASTEKVVKMLKLTSSGYYFTSSLPADQAAGLIKAFEIIENEPQLRKQLWSNIYEIVKGIKTLGLNIPDRFSCIIPILIGDEQKSMKAEEILLEEGIVCSSVRVPAVPKGKSILRITVNASHTNEHITKLLNGLQRAASVLELPLKPTNNADWGKFRDDYFPNYVQL